MLVGAVGGHVGPEFPREDAQILVGEGESSQTLRLFEAYLQTVRELVDVSKNSH